MFVCQFLLDWINAWVLEILSIILTLASPTHRLITDQQDNLIRYNRPISSLILPSLVRMRHLRLYPYAVRVVILAECLHIYIRTVELMNTENDSQIRVSAPLARAAPVWRAMLYLLREGGQR
ncbi:uncharacterized protein EI90DRAFT_2262636 [Cantharellus anzutake]|uniref:uncharacterized protein n=1 Tax=Cantharellus anzutake TaxID=1750568 RepID=UPI001904894C|nr:uncharacterized protein EI90DRAFT_2262636 [Cantharellus anzutake]KAF8339637.1 hypothetical protein EI90DRAFT_2262636 [Cantharellus anzutake]